MRPVFGSVSGSEIPKLVLPMKSCIQYLYHQSQFHATSTTFATSRVYLARVHSSSVIALLFICYLVGSWRTNATFDLCMYCLLVLTDPRGQMEERCKTSYYSITRNRTDVASVSSIIIWANIQVCRYLIQSTMTSV